MTNSLNPSLGHAPLQELMITLVMCGGVHAPVSEMVMGDELDEIAEGLFEIIRNRYPDAEGVAGGTVMLTRPDGFNPSAFTPESVPMVVGKEKFPAASESCTVNTFPELNVPLVVKAKFPVASVVQSIRNGLPVTLPAVIVTEGVEQLEHVLV